MAQADWKKYFEREGIITKGHFLRVSGKHTDYYTQCARLFERPEQAADVCRALADAFGDLHADVVVSAAVGGILLCCEVARALGARSIYMERDSGALCLKRGFTIQKGEKVLIVEDEITTGTSVREMMEVVRALGGETVGVGCLLDRSEGRMAPDTRYRALCTINMGKWRAEDCPLCRAGQPIDRPKPSLR